MKFLVKNKVIKCLLFSFLIVLAIEIFLFNLNDVKTHFYSPKEATYETGSGIKCDKDGFCEVEDNENVYLKITSVDKSSKNLYLDLEPEAGMQEIKIAYKKENGSYEDQTTHLIKDRIELSKYIKLDDLDDVTEIKLLMTTFVDFTLEEVTFNKPYSFSFNFIRMLAVFVFSYFALYYTARIKLKKDGNNKFKIAGAYVVGALLLSCSLYLAKSAYSNYKYEYGHPDSQYYHLAESLAQNEVHLNLKVSDKLRALENPYDTKTRDTLLTRHEDYYWDFAYYDGKYYSYFGVVPCLMFHLPYYLITGNHLSNGIAVILSTSFLVIGAFMLVYTLRKWFFKKVPIYWYLILGTFLFFSSGLAIVLRKPNFYNIPIVLGVGLTLIGLTLWFMATEKKKLNKMALFWGSTCMALVAGCRPQLLLVSFLAFWIFKDYFKDFKKYYKDFLPFIIPYIIIAILMMLYNYVRFDSIINFGAQYNLTTNDMTSRQFSFLRLLISTYVYLFEPVKFDFSYPFIHQFDLNSRFILENVPIISEPTVGGLLFINLVSILGLISFALKKFFKDKKVWLLTIILNIMGLIIMLADSHVAGILPRYYNDFFFLFNLSTIIVILALIDFSKSTKVQVVISILISISLMLNLFLTVNEFYLGLV